MDIEALYSVPKQQARDVLGQVLTAVVGMKGSIPAEDVLPELAQSTLLELARKSGVDMRSAGTSDLARLADAAMKALIEISVGTIDPKATKERAGNLGLIEPSRYRVRHSVETDELSKSTDMSRMRIEDAIHHPDAHQHLFAPSEFSAEAPLVSLFVKLLNRSEAVEDPAKAHWCFVEGKREGSTISVSRAWHIYAADVEIDPLSAKPLDLLTGFVECFGTRLLVFGSPSPSKLFLYRKQRVPFNNVMTIFGIETPKGSEVQTHYLARPTPDHQFLEIAMAYSINITKYKNVLKERKHKH